MKFRGGEFSTGTMGNFQPELTIFTRVRKRTFQLVPGLFRGGAHS
jgi:hypothetical protein